MIKTNVRIYVGADVGIGPYMAVQTIDDSAKQCYHNNKGVKSCISR